MKDLKLIKIINEEISEGVADIYAQKKHGISPEFSEFEKQYNVQQIKSKQMKDNDVVVYSEGNWSLIKNPSSLENIGSSARGVILQNGDLYIESFGGEKIHHDIFKYLYQLGIIKESPKKYWSNRLPQDVGVLTVQRYMNTSDIAIGESNRLIYDKEDYNQYIKYYDVFLEKARKKNPNISFVNKLVGTKFFKTASESVVMSNLSNV